MKICENGITRDMTQTEEAAYMAAVPEQALAADPLTAMAAAMSKATTLAQMRSAAKTFLEATVTNESEE